MFVGEAPGATRTGRACRSSAGRASCSTSCSRRSACARGDVFIANVLKCRPPGNRDPQPDEIEACKPHLFRQIELIEPARDLHARQLRDEAAHGSPHGITRVHGRPQPHELGGRPVLLYPLFHPAAALRTPAMLEPAPRRLRGAAPPARRGAPGSAVAPGARARARAGAGRGRLGADQRGLFGRSSRLP